MSNTIRVIVIAKMPSVRASIRVLLSPLIRFVSPTMSSDSESAQMTEVHFLRLTYIESRLSRRSQRSQGCPSHRNHSSHQVCDLGSHNLPAGADHCKQGNVKWFQARIE